MSAKKKCLPFQSTGTVVWDTDDDEINSDGSNAVIMSMVYFLL